MTQHFTDKRCVADRQSPVNINAIRLLVPLGKWNCQEQILLFREGFQNFHCQIS